ncbi:hypothetical protein F5887DRAFT_888386 [Amanita rubescens]|nr:hypothetical protein F5887DRAFT_888386 [Amanita rubescens]
MKRNPLALTRKLSSIYDTPPPPGHINIIVWTGKLTLNCWIVGEEMGQIFPVVINDSQYVCDLHRAIKKEKSLALENIDASDLVLWEVSIPKSQWSEEKIREKMKGNPLASTTKLSSIYRTLPQRGHVHIIALSRKLTLNCWIVGEEMRQIFSVTINDNQYISDLQRAIKKEKSLALENIDASDLVSWEVSIPKSQFSEEKIREGMKGDPLDSTTTLSSIYCTPPQRDHVHIIAWSPKLNFDVACWIVEKQNTSRMISVSVNSNQLVSDLRWMLKEKSIVPNNVDARLIGLWRVRP